MKYIFVVSTLTFLLVTIGNSYAKKAPQNKSLKANLQKQIIKWLEKNDFDFIDLSHECVKPLLEKASFSIDKEWRNKLNDCLWKEVVADQSEYELLEELDATLRQLKENSISPSIRKKALFIYNFLRQKQGFPAIKGLKKINLDWLESQDYRVWKSEMDEKLSNLNLLDKIRKIFKSAASDEKQTKCKENFHEKRSIYYYNLLKKTVLSTAKKSFGIDWQWLNEIKEEIDLLSNMKKNNYTYASPSQSKLLYEHQQKAAIKEQLIAASHKNLYDGTSTWITDNKYIIALPAIHDLNYRKYVLYHEIGHVYHKDLLFRDKIRIGEITPTDVLNDATFKADIELLNLYTELGKKSFNKTHDLGKIVNDVLKKYFSFWKAPQDQDKFYTMLMETSQEKRADLYSLQKLYEQQSLDAILDVIELYIRSGHIIAYENDEHPSNFERALYMAGFLVFKKIDINKAFNDHNNFGTCTSAEEENTCPCYALHKTKGALDLLQARLNDRRL